MEQQYYSIDQVAKLFGYDVATVRRKIQQGIIPTHPMSEGKRVPKDFVDNWEETTESFAERRYKAMLEQMERENHELKNKLRQITIISLEVER